MNVRVIYKLIVVGFLWFVSQNTYGQNNSLKGIQKIKQLINDEKFEAANKELQNQILHLKSIKNYDTLTS